MPLADFLADLGGGGGRLGPAGAIGKAFGGRTTEQRGIDAFNAQLPAIYDAFDKATTRQEVEAAGRLFTQAWNRNGGPMDERFDKFAEKLAKPALDRVQRADLESIRRDYGPQSAQPRPEGTEGPLTAEGAFMPAREGRPPDLDWAHRMYQATGGKPENIKSIFETPAEVQNKLISNQKTQQSVDEHKAKETEIQGLPNVPETPGGVSQRTVARLTPSGLTQFNPPRPDPLADVKERRIEAQIDRLNRPPAERAPPRGSTEMQDFIAAGGNPQDQAAFMDYLDKRRGRASETVTTVPPPSGLNLEVALAAIAKDAYKQGKTKPEEIQDIARQRGIELEGTPTIDPGGYFGTPKLTGAFTPKTATPRVVTKGKPGATPPTGQPPAQGAPPASNIPPNGTKGKSNSGKPMTVVNGQWRYD